MSQDVLSYNHDCAERKPKGVTSNFSLVLDYILLYENVKLEAL